MADKISTLILKVDLDCHFCYKKIKKVLCRLQEKEDVKAIFYDEKNNTVMIAGAFNPDKVSNWLCCKACKIIKEIEIKDEKPKGDNKSKDDKPKNDKPKDEKPKDEKPKKDDKSKKDDKPKNDKPKDDKAKTVKFKIDEKATDDKPKNNKPKDDKPKQAESGGKPKPVLQKSQPEMPRYEPVVVGRYPQMPMPYQADWPLAGPAGMPGPAGPGCCFRPIYETVYGGGCRCCTCGRSYGFMAGAPTGFYGGAGPVAYGEYNKGYQYMYADDSSMTTCSIM